MRLLYPVLILLVSNSFGYSQISPDDLFRISKPKSITLKKPTPLNRVPLFVNKRIRVKIEIVPASTGKQYCTDEFFVQLIDSVGDVVSRGILMFGHRAPETDKPHKRTLKKEKTNCIQTREHKRNKLKLQHYTRHQTKTGFSCSISGYKLKKGEYQIRVIYSSSGYSAVSTSIKLKVR